MEPIYKPTLQSKLDLRQMQLDLIRRAFPDRKFRLREVFGAGFGHFPTTDDYRIEERFGLCDWRELDIEATLRVITSGDY